jgi:hypothetical protein
MKSKEALIIFGEKQNPWSASAEAEAQAGQGPHIFLVAA